MSAGLAAATVGACCCRHVLYRNLNATTRRQIDPQTLFPSAPAPAPPPPSDASHASGLLSNALGVLAEAARWPELRRSLLQARPRAGCGEGRAQGWAGSGGVEEGINAFACCSFRGRRGGPRYLVAGSGGHAIRPELPSRLSLIVREATPLAVCIGQG